MQVLISVDIWTKVIFIVYGVTLALFGAALSQIILRTSKDYVVAYAFVVIGMVTLFSSYFAMVIGGTFFNSKAPAFTMLGSSFVLLGIVMSFALPLIVIVEQERWQRTHQ